MSEGSISTFSVIISGIKGVGKRSFINLITENKRTSNNVPVMSFEHPPTGIDTTLCFFSNNLIVKGVQSKEVIHENKPRWENDFNSIETKALREIPNHDGISILMYDISNEKSFLTLKEEYNKSKAMNKGFIYLIGNKSDKQMENRQVDYEDAQNFATDKGMMFTEISVDYKKNLGKVQRNIKNGAFQLLKGEKKTPPQLPPRDAEFDNISDSLYSISGGDELEQRLVKKMYYNNKNSNLEEFRNLELENLHPPNQDSK